MCTYSQKREHLQLKMPMQQTNLNCPLHSSLICGKRELQNSEVCSLYYYVAVTSLCSTYFTQDDGNLEKFQSVSYAILLLITRVLLYLLLLTSKYEFYKFAL